MKDKTFDRREAHGLAARWALSVGLWWTASFASLVCSFRQPGLGLLQWVFALLSVVVLVRCVRRYATEVGGMGFLRRWWLSWTTCLNAALLTTLAQYLYFRFLDKGHMLGSMRATMEREEVRQMMAERLPGFDFDAQLELMSQMTLGDITASLLLTNLTAAVVVGLLAALLSRPRTGN